MSDHPYPHRHSFEYHIPAVPGLQGEAGRNMAVRLAGTALPSIMDGLAEAYQSPDDQLYFRDGFWTMVLALGLKHAHASQPLPLIPDDPNRVDYWQRMIEDLRRDDTAWGSLAGEIIEANRRLFSAVLQTTHDQLPDHEGPFFTDGMIAGYLVITEAASVQKALNSLLS